MISGRLSHSVIALLLVICLSPVPASGRFAPISSSGANTILKLTALRAEYKENSLGIDAREPRLSWQIQANGRGVMQSAYGERIVPAPGPGVAALVKEGRLGRKSGRGFYVYKGGKKRGVDESVYGLLGIHPNGGPRPAEILQRLVLGMVNEAARALGEGVVRNPRDGDIGAIFGFGFPPFRGGPLRYADDLGAERVVGDLERLAERYGARFAPSEVLQEHARRGTKFYS